MGNVVLISEDIAIAKEFIKFMVVDTIRPEADTLEVNNPNQDQPPVCRCYLICTMNHPKHSSRFHLCVSLSRT